MKKMISLLILIVLLSGCKPQDVVKETIEISLPNVYTKNGFEVLFVDDQKVILTNKQRLSIINLETNTEDIIVEAEFGVNGAANKDYIVYGVGGDEFWEVFSYNMNTRLTYSIFTDNVGMLDLEIDTANNVYFSKVSLNKNSYYVSSWHKYNLETNKQETIPSFERSMAAYLLKNSGLDLDTTWNHKIGTTRYEVYYDLDTFAYCEITLLESSLYDTKIYEYTNGKAKLIVEDVRDVPYIIYYYNGLLTYDNITYPYGSSKIINKVPSVQLLHGEKSIYVTSNEYGKFNRLFIEK